MSDFVSDALSEYKKRQKKLRKAGITPKYEPPEMPKTAPAKKTHNINHEEVEKLVKELTEKPFVMGKNSIETESFRIWVFEKEVTRNETYRGGV